MTFQELQLTLRRSKFLYYLAGFSRLLVPNGIYRHVLRKKLHSIYSCDSTDVLARVNYYNKMERYCGIGWNAENINDLKTLPKPKMYRFDAMEYLRYFDDRFRANFLFGDVRHVADLPTIQKSRPVNDSNANAVLLKLNKKRHFLFVKDRKTFSAKKDLLFWRGVVTQEHRERFMNMHFDHRLCDLGQVNKKGGNVLWQKKKVSIPVHLDHKFILSVEGNDVATNLKWIMSSNSVAVMTKPKFETWFMEGRLVAGVHYIEIKDDYSDVEEKLNYYIAHPEEATAITKNANEYVKQFTDKKQEDLIALLVLQKYFYYTLQEEAYVTPKRSTGKFHLHYLPDHTATGALIPG